MFSIFPLNNDISNPERQVKRVLRESINHQSMLAHTMKKNSAQEGRRVKVWFPLEQTLQTWRQWAFAEGSAGTQWKVLTKVNLNYKLQTADTPFSNIFSSVFRAQTDQTCIKRFLQK